MGEVKIMESEIPTTIKELTINGETKSYEVNIVGNDSETITSVIAMSAMSMCDNDPFVRLGINDWAETREEDHPVYSYESPDGLLSIEFDDYSNVDLHVDLTQPTSVWLFNSSVEGALKVEGYGGLFNCELEGKKIILRDSLLFNQTDLPDGNLLINTTIIHLAKSKVTAVKE